jgi:uncharacterized protein (DUF2235 family)
MRKLVVCADGTWNDEDRQCAPTNVAKLHRALKTQHVERVPQLVFYHSGVGTKWDERLHGGAFGFGINRNIKQCYRFLVDNYQPGDELYFVGFSRGAYTVRSLAGLINNAGIVKDPKHIDAAFKLYRARRDSKRPSSDASREFRRTHSHPRTAHLAADGGAPDIKFIGVWDTVGSLGIPLPFFSVFRRILPLVGIDWWFHDTRLSKLVQNAFHALAIHERRSDFPVTLWHQDLNADGKPKRADQVLEQRWFPGVHSDVGGGYGASGLSDLSFLWMVAKAQSCGLEFRLQAVEPGLNLAPDPLGAQHESFTGVFLLLDAVRGRFRGVPRQFGGRPQAREAFSDGALTRYRDMPGASWPGSPLSNLAERIKVFAAEAVAAVTESDVSAQVPVVTTGPAAPANTQQAVAYPKASQA